MKTKTLTITGIMAAIAGVLMLIETPIPFFPAFLQFDISDLPAIVTSFAIGPVYGIIVELIKNLIHLLFAGKTGGVGELANFIVGISLILPAALIYKKKKTRKMAMIGLGAGATTMTVTAIFVNIFITIPFFSKIMPIETIIASAAEVNPLIKDVTTLVIYGITPFNILKGIILIILTTLIYKHISRFLGRK